MHPWGRLARCLNGLLSEAGGAYWPLATYLCPFFGTFTTLYPSASETPEMVTPSGGGGGGLAPARGRQGRAPPRPACVWGSGVPAACAGPVLSALVRSRWGPGGLLWCRHSD